MIKNVMEQNEKATPNGADLEVLKKHFGSCFNSGGMLDVEKLKARLEGQVALLLKVSMPPNWKGVIPC